MVSELERPSGSVTVRDILYVPEVSNLYDFGFSFSIIWSGNVHL